MTTMIRAQIKGVDIRCGVKDCGCFFGVIDGAEMVVQRSRWFIPPDHPGLLIATKNPPASKGSGEHIRVKRWPLPHLIRCPRCKFVQEIAA